MTANDVKVNSVQPDKNGTLSHMKIQRLTDQSQLSIVPSDAYSIHFDLSLADLLQVET